MELDLNQSDSQDTDGLTPRKDLARIRRIEKEEGLGAAVRATISYLHEQQDADQGYVMLARLLTKQKRYDDARRAAEKARVLAPLTAEPHIALGLVALRKKDYSEAAIAFADAIKIDPNTARGHLGAAAVRLADENFNDALTFCEKALELDPSMDRAHELMARINMRRGETEQALAGLKDLTERNPGNKRAFKAYIRLMRSEGRGDEALEYLKQTSERQPGDRRSLSRLARVAVASGNADVALGKYKAIVNSGEVHVTDRVFYIVALIEAGDLKEAEAQIDQLGDRQVFKPIAAKLRGDIALRSGDADAALHLYQQACAGARISAPTEAVAMEGPSEARAEFWKAYAHKGLVAAIRERRSKSA